MRRKFLDFIIMHPPGVTNLDRFLSLVREHPNLGILKKETHYFSSESFTHGASWYEEQFRESGAEVQGELSTSYLHTPGVAARISREYPDARLVAMLCDPREAVYASYKIACVGKAVSPSLEEWLEVNPEVLKRFLFGKQLLSFFGYYSPVDLLVLTVDDLSENAGKAFVKLCTLLDVPATYIPKALRVLTEDEKKSGFWARRLRIDRWRKRRREQRIAYAHSLFAKAAIPLSARESVLLARYYEKDVAALSDLLQRDLLTEWQYPTVDPKAKKNG